MQMVRPVIGMIMTLGVVIYCGRLVYYFVDLTGSMEEVWKQGLGPTVLGLSAFGLLAFVVLLVRVVLFVARLRLPGSGGKGGPHTPAPDGDSGLDADAVIARYMAQRSAQGDDVPGAPNATVAPRAPEDGVPPTRPSFGRRIR